MAKNFIHIILFYFLLSLHFQGCNDISNPSIVKGTVKDFHTKTPLKNQVLHIWWGGEPIFEFSSDIIHTFHSDENGEFNYQFMAQRTNGDYFIGVNTFFDKSDLYEDYSLVWPIAVRTGIENFYELNPRAFKTLSLTFINQSQIYDSLKVNVFEIDNSNEYKTGNVKIDGLNLKTNFSKDFRNFRVEQGIMNSIRIDLYRKIRKDPSYYYPDTSYYFKLYVDEVIDTLYKDVIF